MRKFRAVLLAAAVAASAVGIVGVEANVAGAAYPTSGTVDTIGNHAIPGTSNSVSCWRTWGANGTSTNNCWRYDQYSNPNGFAQFTLPEWCSTIQWLAGSPATLAYSNSAYYNNGTDHPTWNGRTGGCYKGTDQSGSAAWYEEYTINGSTCTQENPPGYNVSGCSIQNNGNAGGATWNFSGVTRGTTADINAYTWPTGQSVYTWANFAQ